MQAWCACLGDPPGLQPMKACLLGSAGSAVVQAICKGPVGGPSLLYCGAAGISRVARL